MVEPNSGFGVGLSGAYGDLLQCAGRLWQPARSRRQAAHCFAAGNFSLVLPDRRYRYLAKMATPRFSAESPECAAVAARQMTECVRQWNNNLRRFVSGHDF